MRAGKQSVPVEILSRSTVKDKFGQQDTALTLWRQVWANFQPFRGGELTLAEGVEHNPTAKFRFAFLDVMAPDANGVVLRSDMILRVEGQLWDIDVIHPDLTTRRDVMVMAIQKRFVV